jgi:hypothetical protein
MAYPSTPWFFNEPDRVTPLFFTHYVDAAEGNDWHTRPQVEGS